MDVRSVLSTASDREGTSVATPSERPGDSYRRRKTLIELTRERQLCEGEKQRSDCQMNPGRFKARSYYSTHVTSFLLPLAI